VAERRRRGNDPAEDPREDELSAEDAEIEDEFADEVDDLDEDDDAVVSDEDDDRASGSGRAGTKTKKEASPPDKKATKTKDEGRRGPIGRLVNFFREVVAELRKVIWPTRKELVTYTTVVVVFVLIITALVAVFDLAFGKAVLAIFGE